jgi:hypothetical protein
MRRLHEGKWSCAGKSTILSSNGLHMTNVGFDILTVVTMKSPIFWNVGLYSLVEAHRYWLCFPPTSWWLLGWLILQPWKWRQYVPSKLWWTSTRLYDVTSQKIVLFSNRNISSECLFCSLNISMSHLMPSIGRNAVLID